MGWFDLRDAEHFAASLAQEGLETAKIGVEQGAEVDLFTSEDAFAHKEMVHELKGLVRQESAKRLEIFNVAEAASASIGEYKAALASGLGGPDSRVSGPVAMGR